MGADHRPEVDRQQRVLGGDVAPAAASTSAKSSQAPSATARRSSGASALHLVDQVGERARPGALLGLLGDLAVLHLDHRLDGEERAEQGPGPADAPAPLEVLEPAEDPVDAGAGDAVLGGGDQLVQLGAAGGLLGGGDDEQPLAHGERDGVDDPHGHAVKVPAAVTGRGVGGRDLRGDGEAEHGVGPFVGGLLERGLEGAGGGRGRLGQGALAAAAVPELGGRELAPVLELLGCRSGW